MNQALQSQSPATIAFKNALPDPFKKINKLTDKAPMQKSAAYTYTCSPTSRKIDEENIYSFFCIQSTWQHEILNDDIAGSRWRLQLGSVRQDFEEIGPGEYEKF